MKKVDIDKIYNILKKESKNFKVPVIDLIQMQYKDPFKVLVGTILSARTKDEVTMNASKRLFKLVKKVNDLDKLSQNQIEKLIYPVGFYKTKAKHLKELPGVLQAKFNGVIPDTVEELIELPGVGRKTANLVVAVGFQKPAMCIDTHCHRIPQRIGWFISKSPYDTEMIMRKIIPIKYWEKINSLFVAFGQYICRPISPKCSICPIKKYCKRVGVTTSR